MPSLLASPPPEALSRGPTGLSIRNVLVALKSGSQFLQLVPTNIAADLASVCARSSFSLHQCEYEKKATSIPGSIGTGAQAVAVRPLSVSIPGRCAQCWIVYAKRGKGNEISHPFRSPPICR